MPPLTIGQSWLEQDFQRWVCCAEVCPILPLGTLSFKEAFSFLRDTGWAKAI